MHASNGKRSFRLSGNQLLRIAFVPCRGDQLCELTIQRGIELPCVALQAPKPLTKVVLLRFNQTDDHRGRRVMDAKVEPTAVGTSVGDPGSGAHGARKFHDPSHSSTFDSGNFNDDQAR